MNAKHKWADEIIALALGFEVQAKYEGNWFTPPGNYGFGAFELPGFEFRIKGTDCGIKGVGTSTN